MSTRSVVADAAGGAFAGAAAVAGAYLAFQLAEAYARADSNNYTNSADALGDFALMFASMFVACGLAFGSLAAYASARLSGLPRPWLVSLVGLAISSLLLCGAGGQGIVWRILLMILIYVGVAVIVGAVFPRKRR